MKSKFAAISVFNAETDDRPHVCDVAFAFYDEEDKMRTRNDDD
jgi:hypothetical protein